MLNKKGSGWLMGFYAVLMVIAGTTLLYHINLAKEDTTEKLGEVQANTIDVYYKSEERGNELGLKTRFLVGESLLEISENGGFGKDNKCDRENGYVVWDLDKCWADVEKNFLLLLQEKMKEKRIEHKKMELEDNWLNISFGEEEFKRVVGNAEISYTREIRFSENVDFLRIVEKKKEVLNAFNNKDFSKLGGKVNGEYMEFSIENDKNMLKFKTGGLLEARKPVFRFAVKTT